MNGGRRGRELDSLKGLCDSVLLTERIPCDLARRSLRMPLRTTNAIVYLWNRSHNCRNGDQPSAKKRLSEWNT